MLNNADRYHTLAGGLGPLWKRHRRHLPPSVRSAFAQLLLETRLYVMPSSSLDAASVIGNARFDIRCVTELLAYVAGAAIHDEVLLEEAPCDESSAAIHDDMSATANKVFLEEALCDERVAAIHDDMSATADEVFRVEAVSAEACFGLAGPEAALAERVVVLEAKANNVPDQQVELLAMVRAEMVVQDDRVRKTWQCNCDRLT